MNNKIKKTGWIMACLLAFCVCMVFVTFYSLTLQYRHNSAYSGASHLMEINRQGVANISSLLQKQQDLARDICSELKEDSFGTQQDLLDYIRIHKSIWNENDIYIYTEAGLCVNSDGLVQNNGDAARFAYETIQSGESFRIIKSQTEFACAVDSALLVRGSRVVAVSVVHDLDTLIDDMGFNPFSGGSTVYLTRQNGVRICQSSNSGAASVYNVMSSFESGRMEDLTGSGLTPSGVMAAAGEGAFLYRDGGSFPKYVVMTPVEFAGQTLYLFTIVPQSTVNQTMNEFSNRMVLLTTLVIFIITGIFVFFFWLYQKKSRVYDADLRSRERLFDLLVSETRNAYMLLETDSARPAYISSNMEDILGEGLVCIRKQDSGYVLTGEAGGDSRVLAEVNSALAGWDGKREFISGYLPYSHGGTDSYLRLSIYPAAARADEYIGIVQDVTPEYRREENLKEALAMANSANRAKTRFLSSVSHDIRTPLNAIINMTRFLRHDLDDRNKALDEIEIISQSSEHLLGLINDVLDLSRIESGKFSFASENFNLDSVLAGVCDIVRPLCAAKAQRFVFSAVEINRPALVGDQLRLNQILINILNNAVKFTPERGEIDFTVTQLPAIRAGSVPFRFVVRDNGIGIPRENLSSIFDPFSRAEGETVQRIEGSGLGLAITKNFVEAMGGSISVESEPGRGSTFTVELYFAEGDAAAGEPALPCCSARFDGLRALVVEDNAINMSIAATILEGWGFAVERAENGRIAADMFSGSSEGYYSIIFMDIRMPVMNGYEAAQAIRASRRADSSVPIVAMTANAFSEDVEHARAAGMNAHVAKPIEPDELRRTAAGLLKKYAPDAT
jgi:signal transduction histidine kinase